MVKFFKIDVTLYGNKFIGRCPVHGGDNSRAFNFYPKSGYWKCWSHGCHENVGNSIQALEQILLQKNNITVMDSNIEVEPIHIQQKERREIILSIEDFLKNKIYPCPYFKNKYGIEATRKFYIAYCKEAKNPMCKRSVVPMIADGKVVGWQGRSIYEECEKCNSFHSPYIPCSEYFSPKWKMAEGFYSSEYLYNADSIKTKYAFITESVGNVLAMDKIGKVAAATLGVQFSKKQREILKSKGVETIIYLKDAGEAGDQAAERVKSTWDGKVIVPKLDITDDIAAINDNLLYTKIKEIENDYSLHG